MPTDIEVIRSTRRRRTVQARLEGDKVVVRIPAHMTKAEEENVVSEMLAKLERKTTSSRTSDADLRARAEQLNVTVLAGRARLGSIRWVSNQTTRWGSCTTATGDIRITDRLQRVPDYVLDAVIVHELTHTFIPGHGPAFWQWADRVPKAERAKGYLEAYQRFGVPEVPGIPRVGE